MHHRKPAIFPDKTRMSVDELHEHPSGSREFIGGLRVGYAYKEFFFAAESIHQNVGFSGYPIGGITMDTALYGSVEDLCKAQSVERSAR